MKFAAFDSNDSRVVAVVVFGMVDDDDDDDEDGNGKIEASECILPCTMEVFSSCV